MGRRPAVALTTGILVICLQTTSMATNDWPAIFDPLVLRTLNLSLDPHDWNTIRHDSTNEIKVPAMLWADAETPILVTVRRKSSRALPSESNPVKIGLKIDIDDLVEGQTWHGLKKISIENGADSGVVQEGLAWNMHRFATDTGAAGYPSGFASWVRVNVNGQYIGVSINAEQRDKQALRQRGLWVGGETWLYEQDGGGVLIEEGDPDSPGVNHLCYSPFRPKGKGACPTPGDVALQADLQAWLEMDGFLTQCAVEALTDNTDALCSHGKNTFFVDFSVARMTTDGLRRIYLPWDLDTVFHNAQSNIYAVRSGRRIIQNPYEQVILNHPSFRAQYNTKILDLTDPTFGRLSETVLHNFLDQVSVLLAQAMAEDPYPAENDGPSTFADLKAFLTERITSARAQALANTNPPPRP